MKPIIAAAISLSLGMAPAAGQNISPNGSRPSTKGPAEYFTGSVTVDPLFGANAHMPSTGGHVTFEPGARTAWHTHPLGQTLFVTSGVGRVQTWGGPVREIRAGDTVWIPPAEKHWHGATAEHAMEHIAMQEAQGGEHVKWLEPVTDEQYSAKAES